MSDEKRKLHSNEPVPMDALVDRERKWNPKRPPFVFDANGIRHVSGIYPWARQESHARLALLRYWAPKLGLDRWHTGLDPVAYNLAIDAMIWNAKLIPGEGGRRVRFDRDDLLHCFLAGVRPVWSC